MAPDDDRAVMRWFRSLPPDGQQQVSVYPRQRGTTMIAPRRRLPAGRNVRCSICPHRPIVWFTNEGGRPAQRAAEIAAARHLWTHLTDARTAVI